MKRLLVVDWDYFFPIIERPEDGEHMEFLMYDWGHNEQQHRQMFLNYIWIGRAATFKTAGLPIPNTSGLEAAFWQRFRFSPKAELYYADSNVMAVDDVVAEGIQEVWLFDAHHDSGYKGSIADIIERSTVSCEDWMVNYISVQRLPHVRYPQWRHYAMEIEPKPLIAIDRQVDDEQPMRQMFHRVFVCRSGAWTPPWIDSKFASFIASCPVRQKHNLDGLMERSFDWNDVDQHSEALESLRAVSDRNPVQ